MRGRPWLLVFVGVALLGLGYGLRQLHVAASVGTGYAAKVTCSLVFNSGRDPEQIMRRYVAPEITPLGALVDVDVDREAARVEASVLGLVHAHALHRPGLGCTLVADASGAALRSQALPPELVPPAPTAAPLDPRQPWPYGAAGPAEPPPPAVAAALEQAFAAQPEAAAGTPLRQTTAVVVAQHGRLVAERYAPSYGPTTPMLSWSMAKSVLAALVGIAADEGLLALDAPAPVAAWQEPGDPRRSITVDQLLRQSSGLAFDEHYGAVNDVSRMLFTRGDMGAFAASFGLDHPPDQVWSYSSGTSNLLARLLRQALGGELVQVVRFARTRLFEPADMHTAFFEPDASGSFVGSSFVFASPRDWARFGQLHLQDGIWEGRRVLPEGWVDYVTTPTPGAPEGSYGAHWWLNAGDREHPEQRTWPRLPREVHAARGHSGQAVVVDPTAELVVVRLGLDHPGAEPGIEALVAALRDALAP